MPILTANERLGTEIGGRYRIVRIIGEGGFSAVFEAEHLMTGRAVALKLLHAHLVQTEQVSQRFLIEAQTMAKIRHPGIVQVLDAGREPDGAIFIALELLEGETLEAVLARSGRLTLHEAAKITSEVLDALSAAHAHKVVHRDIKPANIFLAREPDGRTTSKLLDFGIAHVAPKNGGKLTTAGVILGTPEYMSPEQARGGAIDAAADLWSVGVVLYELLSGVVPWTNENATALLMSIASDPLPDIRHFVPDLPAPLWGVIQRALEKDPARRYASAEEMRRSLAEAMRDAQEDPAGEFAIIAGGMRHGGVTPTPGPLIRPRLPNKEQGVTANARSGEAPRVKSDPAFRASAPAGMIPGSAREFEFDTGGVDVSLDLAEGVADAIRRPSSSALPVPPSVASLGTAPATATMDLDLPLPPPPRAQDVEASTRTSVAHAAPGMSVPGATASAAITGAHGSLSAASATGMHRAANATGAHRAQAAPAALAAAPSPSRPGEITFAAPSKSRAPLWIGVGVVALVAAGGGAIALRGGRTMHSGTTRAGSDEPEPSRGVDGDAAARSAQSPVRDLVQRYGIAAPFGTDDDSLRAFARHMAVGPLRSGGAMRTIASCTRTSVFFYAGGDGLPINSGPAEVACEQHDLAVVPDLDGDGHDDVAAITRGHDGVVLLGSRTLRPLRTIPVPRALGLVDGPNVRGEPAVIVYAEPGGPTGETELVAIALRSGQVLWRAAGRAPLVRFGHPSELGLAVGDDASGDGVQDVVAGAAVPNGVAPGHVPARPRCVELLSGATGERVWREPFCQPRGGAQSVSLGPDLDGDGRGDVAVGTDVVRGSEPSVVLISGADAHLLRRIGPFPGPGARGFGWPVYLGGDVDGDGAPDVVVGSVGGEGTFVTLASARDGHRIAAQRLRGEVGFPFLRVMTGMGLVHGSATALIASSPEDGLHVFTVSGGP